MNQEEFQFDIDSIAANAVSKVDKTTNLIVSSSLEDKTQIRFLEKLTPDQQAAITAKVPALVDNFVADQNSLLDFGQGAVEEVNRTVNALLAEQKKIQIPQVDEILRNANKELNGFVAKYKDAQVAELDKKPNIFERLFKKSKDTLQEFYFDSQNIEQKMDGMAKTVVVQENILANNIVSAEQLIASTSGSIENLVGVISFIEAAQLEANKRAVELQQGLVNLDMTSVEYQTKSQELARMTEVVNTLEQQHTEYVGRLYIAWVTTPQMRNLIKVSADMRQKLGMLRRNTIPTMKLSIVQLGMLQQSMKSGKVADAIANANNAALQMMAETSKEVIPMLEKISQSPTLAMESVTKLADSILAQNKGIIEAIESGREKRNLLESTIIKSAEAINDSLKVRDVKIVSALLNQAITSQEELTAAEPN